MTTSHAHNSAERQVQEAIHGHWAWFLVQGFVMAALGVAAVIEPMVATFAVTTFVGCLLLGGGIVSFVAVLTGRQILSFRSLLFTAVLLIAIGAYLVWRPLEGIGSLALAAAIFFGAQSIAQLIVALNHRSVLVSWVWVLLSGIVNCALAAIVLSEALGPAERTLGLMFGINLFMWGFALVMTALASRSP